MKKPLLLLLACCIGLSAGLSCTTRKAQSSSAQSLPGQAAADAEARKKAATEAKLKQYEDAKIAADAAEAKKAEEAKISAADAEARKKAVSEAKLKREQDESLAIAEAKARKLQDAAAAKALKKSQADAARQANTPQSARPAAAATGALSAKAQKLDDLNRRYINGQITPEEYHAERAKIVAEPDMPDAPAPAK